MKEFLLVNKFDLDKESLELPLQFHSESKKHLPEGVKSIFIPKEWNVTVVSDKCIQIDLTTDLDFEFSESLLDSVREDIGEDVTVLVHLGETEFL